MKRISPTAVIFDYGNVLSQPQGLAEIESMASILNLPVPRFRELSWRFRLAYDEGRLDPADYWNTVATEASRTVTQEQIAELVELDSHSWAYPAPSLPEWARQLKQAGHVTALLSNMPATVREHVTRCHWFPPFDQQIFSCDVRLAKPAPEIYRHTLAALGLEPASVVFLDDRPENIRAAEGLGMHGVVFTSLEKVAAELDQRFDIAVPLAATLDRGQ